MTKSDRNILKLLLIKEAIDQIKIFIEGVNYEKFLNDKLLISALSYYVIKVGYLCKRLNNIITDKYNDIPWENFFSTAQKLQTEYYNIDYKNLWSLINNDIRKLSNPINRIIKNEFNN